MSPRSKPEIMSPAGYWPQLRAAIEAGADSVYFGLKRFSARAKVGFSAEELPEALATLHRRGIKGYVTFNTLVFDHELREAARVLALIAEAGADAIIVQDVGMLKLARAIAPDLELHASTQMSVTNPDGVRLAQRLGASRVTLARELSLAEIRSIRAQTDCELEIFVHGALCVAYSGQCLSSEAWGGRSANRGQCAQACRLPYELLVDGAVEPLGDARYLLSPGDLYALRQVPEIAEIGIAALKIEGRYKDADYVALTTRAYREAVDQAWAGRELHVYPHRELELEQVYSRGLGPFFLNGTDHQAVVRGRAPRHRGVFMGRVTRVTDTGIRIEPSEANHLAPLKPGDGVVFDAAGWRSPEEPEEGGRIFQIEARGDSLELRFGNDAIRPDRIRRGDLLWRTHDPNVDKAARVFTEARVPLRKRPVDVAVVAREGQRLRSEWRVGEHRVLVESDAVLGTAQNRAINEDLLRGQLGRLGNTAFELAGIELKVEGRPFAPTSMLNQVRREAVERLASHASAGARQVMDPEAALQAITPPALPANCDTIPVLHLLVRTPEQLDAALLLRPNSITLDYLDLYGLKPSIERVRSAGVVVRVASPRVLKPGEERIADFLESCHCPILVRSAGLLYQLRERGRRPLIGDFSLNAANEITAAELFSLGVERLTPAHDLNAAQITQLARKAGAERFEVVAYHHLPVFHTEHCVFCRFLTAGTSYRDCGRPCESHRVALRDTSGRDHPVMADVGCRNTVFGAEAQQAGAHVAEWLSAGICHFRLEFAHETAAQVTAVTESFAAVLSGNTRPQDFAKVLARIAPGGVTEGSLFVPQGFFELPVLQ